MSGSWQISHSPKNLKHGHIELIDRSKETFGVLTYVDPRRFGHFYILSNEHFKLIKMKMPFDITSSEFNLDHIAELFFRFPQKMLKPFLLDQKAFPGVGNYMASEICARSGILPTRLCGEIEASEIIKIKTAIDVVVKSAIETKGTTFSGGYRDANGEKGEGVKNLVVFYQTHCQLCLERKILCKVIKSELMGRGTYHCQFCQK